MSKSRNRWAVPILVVIVAAVVYAAMTFRIEEAAERHSVTVTWDETEMTGVSYCQFSNANEAEPFADPDHDDDYFTFQPIEVGESIVITRLLSGWNESRILHKFVAFDFALSSGQRMRTVVRITPEMLSGDRLDIPAGHVE
jgi:hypothetical protein